MNWIEGIDIYVYDWGLQNVNTEIKITQNIDVYEYSVLTIEVYAPKFFWLLGTFQI